MADRSITSADSTYSLSSADFGLAATLLEGYAADASFAMDGVDIAETMIGVDGKMSAGWTPRIYTQTITLQADSPSRKIFDAIVAFQDVNRNPVRLNGDITTPGNQYTYSLRRGVLKSYSAMPSAQRVLQPMTYTIDWETVRAVPIG